MQVCRQNSLVMIKNTKHKLLLKNAFATQWHQRQRLCKYKKKIFQDRKNSSRELKMIMKTISMSFHGVIIEVQVFCFCIWVSHLICTASHRIVSSSFIFFLLFILTRIFNEAKETNFVVAVLNWKCILFLVRKKNVMMMWVL